MQGIGSGGGRIGRTKSGISVVAVNVDRLEDGARDLAAAGDPPLGRLVAAVRLDVVEQHDGLDEDSLPIHRGERTRSTIVVHAGGPAEPWYRRENTIHNRVTRRRPGGIAVQGREHTTIYTIV